MTININTVNAAIEAKEYETAASQAVELLKSNPASGPLRLASSVANLRTGNFQRGLEDAERAVAYLSGEKRANAQFRRLLCHFRLGQMAKAAGLVQYCTNSSDKNELSVVKKKFQDVEPEKMIEIPVFEDTETKKAPIAPATKEVRKDWYRMGSYQTLVVYIRDAPKDTKVHFDSRHITVETAEIKETIPVDFEFDQSKTIVNIGKYNIEIKIPVDESVPQVKAPISTPAPTAAPKAKVTDDYRAPFERNWDNISDSEEEKEDSDPNAFFQKLYKDADPDVQRAMMKSYIESKGTSLSTNWDEVKKGPVEPQPPSDMRLN